MKSTLLTSFIALLFFAVTTASAQRMTGPSTEQFKGTYAGTCIKKNDPPPAAADTAQIPGIIGFSGEELDEAVRVPARVPAGQDFQVEITTSGNGCVSAGESALILAEKSADIFVYDRTTAVRPGTVCTMILKKLPHTVTLRFDEPGEATIRIWGRKQGGDGSSPLGEPVIIEKRVLIR